MAECSRHPGNSLPDCWYCRNRAEPEPIPGEWLSAATLATESLPVGTSAAHLANTVLDVVVPLVRAEGAPVEWGVTASVLGMPAESAYDSEDEARDMHRSIRDQHPEWNPRLARRTAAQPAGEWQEVPDA